jgi:type IV pilus assembly protein PilN
MLKINLLPIRQLKKRSRAARQLLAMFLLFLVVLAVLAGVGMLQWNKIKGLEQEIAALESEKASYTPILTKIDKLKKDTLELARKTEVINTLKTDSSLTVRVLDEVARRLDNQRMWLESLHQQDAALRLSGVALDNQTIAQFMDHLKESPFVHDVTLTGASLKVVSGRNLKSFELNCVVGQPQATDPAATVATN